MTLENHLHSMFGDRQAPDGGLVRDNFARWFGVSQVVDPSGSPLVVFHGTRDDFSRFDTDATEDGAFHFGTSKAAWDAVYDNPDYESEYDAPSLMPVYLSIKNPMRADDQDSDWGEAIADAKAKGHDGIVYKNAHEDVGSDSWIAFHPSQIKSAICNSGAFNRRDADITDSKAAGLAKVMRAKEAIEVAERLNSLQRAYAIKG